MCSSTPHKAGNQISDSRKKKSVKETEISCVTDELSKPVPLGKVIQWLHDS